MALRFGRARLLPSRALRAIAGCHCWLAQQRSFTCPLDAANRNPRLNLAVNRRRLHNTSVTTGSDNSIGRGSSTLAFAAHTRALSSRFPPCIDYLYVHRVPSLSRIEPLRYADPRSESLDRRNAAGAAARSIQGRAG